MLALRIALAGVLALVLVLAAPAAAQEEDAPAPLLQAMAYVHPKADPVSVDFVDWAQLKRLYGYEGISSASPLEERQRFMLEVARNEAAPVPLGLDRLATWPATWGWDNTDLDWQARYWDGRNVLRFGEHWDPAPFRAALESFGFERDASGAIEVWQPPEARIPSDVLLERVGQEIDAPEMTLTFAPVTISGDGRTVIIHDIGPAGPPKPLRRAARPNLERVAATPAVRAASALGDAIAGTVTATSPDYLCRWPWEDTLAEDPEVSAVVEGLHQYQARADGYARSDADAPAMIRYVFSYQRPRQARADLEARSTLVELGTPWVSPAGEVALLDARAEGQELILDVEPVHGQPVPYMGWRFVWAPFASCGPPR